MTSSRETNEQPSASEPSLQVALQLLSRLTLQVNELEQRLQDSTCQKCGHSLADVGHVSSVSSLVVCDEQQAQQQEAASNIWKAKIPDASRDSFLRRFPSSVTDNGDEGIPMLATRVVRLCV